MGTRGLTKVIDSEGRTKVAQYGQWDHYPQGQGVNMLSILSHYGIIDRIENNLRKVHFLSDEEVETYFNGYTNNDGWMTLEQGNAFDLVFPALSRNTGTDILNVIAYSTGYTLGLRDESNFEMDELFCEGVFTLNYQTREFISKCGVEVRFPLDKLPTIDVYLNAFEEAYNKERAMA